MFSDLSDVRSEKYENKKEYSQKSNAADTCSAPTKV